MHIGALLGIWLITLGGPMATQSAPPPDPLLPARGLIGNWRCNGKSFAVAKQPERTYTYSMDVREALRGRWLAFTVLLTPSGATSPVLEGHDYWGVDAATQKVAEVYVDSSGTYGQGAFTEIANDRLTYRGRVSGDPGERHYEVTFTRESPHLWRIRYRGSKDGRIWRQRTEDTCAQ